MVTSTKNIPFQSDRTPPIFTDFMESPYYVVPGKTLKNTQRSGKFSVHNCSMNNSR